LDGHVRSSDIDRKDGFLSSEIHPLRHPSQIDYLEAKVCAQRTNAEMAGLKTVFRIEATWPALLLDRLLLQYDTWGQKV
jgi:hypothetical protein